MFWSVPGTPGRLRTVPLRLGGRPVSAGGFFLGQDANRLLGLAIPSILGRIALAPAYQAYLHPPPPHPGPQGAAAFMLPWPQRTVAPQVAAPVVDFQIPPVSDQDAPVLLGIRQNPTGDELADLSYIDRVLNGAFSSPRWQGNTITTADVCARVKQAVQYPSMIQTRPLTPMESAYGPSKGLPPQPGTYLVGYLASGSPPAGQAILDDPFFCPSLSSSGVPINYNGIDLNGTWGAQKLHVQNAVTLADTIHSYPFPPPIDTDITYFLTVPQVAQDMATMVGFNVPLDPEALRYWITLSVVANYDSMASRMQADAKAEAKKKKRVMLLRAIAIVVAGVVAAIVLPEIIGVAISAIKAGIEAYQQVKQAKAAAKAMEDTSKLFEKDAPAFAAQADKTAKFLDAQTAAQEAAAPLSPDMQAAVDEVGAQTPPNLLVPGLVAGGLAAAGGAAFLIFR